MRTRWFVLASVLGLGGSASASQTCYVDIVNDSQYSVESIDYATTENPAWTRIDLGGPLQGGYAGQATVAFHPDPESTYNLRVRFADGHWMEITGLDPCRTRSLHLGLARLLGERIRTQMMRSDNSKHGTL